MSDLEKKWKKNLTSILEELDSQQYKKTLFLLDKIPKGFKGGKTKETMAQKIIEVYGAKESIIEIRKIMEDIPRRDHAVQKLLLPFKRIGDKRQKKKKDKQQSSTPEKRKNIHLLKSCGQLLDTEIIVGKVVKKSDLKTYRTKTEEEKFFFYVTVSDRTDCIKVMVYGREHYESIREESCYSFKSVIVEKNMIKVTKRSRVLKHKAIKVPPHLEKEAQSLFYKRPDFATAETSA